MTVQTVAPPSAQRPMRFAATLIVLRDSPRGLEVLMLRRADKANDQNSGASVFPGGVIDAHDRSLHRLCDGVDDAAASARLGLADGGLDYYVAAVRECFEEAGILIASDAAGQVVALDQLPPDSLAAMRNAAAQGTDALLALCESQGWRLAMDRLVYFSHWLTPPGMPRRFDTRFFVAAMPSGQSALCDGVEIAQQRWLTPEEALSPALSLKLMNVTRRTLEQLAAFESVAACMAHAQGQTHRPMNMPRLADGPAGRRAVNMEEAAYDEIAHVDPDGQGGGRYELEAGLVMRLSERIWRVTGGADGMSAAPGAHSYFVGGGDGGDWALIDPMPEDSAHYAALRAAAPGRVRWVLSTKLDADLSASWPEASVWQPMPGEALDLGGGTLRALRGQDGFQFLLEEERTLFTGTAAPVDGQAREAVEWLAPEYGFVIKTARHRVAEP